MVFQKEGKASWLWPLICSPVDAFRDSVPKNGGKLSEEEIDRRDRERGFDIADSLESGFARETVTDFVHPLKSSRALWRFHVVRSQDKLNYRLFAEDGAFLMYAKACIEAARVEFFLYDPSDKAAWGPGLFDPSRPQFVMTFNKDTTAWRITQERCESCRFSPKHLSCACHGKQQIAAISHSQTQIGGGLFNCMEMNVPGRYADGTRVVWCPLAGLGDLADFGSDDGPEAEHLATKQPAWNKEVDSLVLDFRGRDILPSAKNFQLVDRSRPGNVVCQYGKIGPNTFSLDFQYPLSVIQAFGSSLTTLFWV
jgi:hypothetical protein